MKRIAWYTAIVLFTLTGVFVLWQFRTPILLFILSLAVAAIVRPVVNLLAARGIPRGLALAITYLAVVGIIVALGIFLVGPLIDEMQALVADLPGRYSQTQTQWSNGSGLQQLMAAILPDIDNFSEIITGGKWELFIQNLMEMTLGSLDVLSHILLVFVLSIYWSADEEHFKRLWLSLLPLDQRTRWRDIWQNIEKEIGGYLRSEFFQSLLTVIILGIGYQLIGLQYPVFFAIFAAISWLIVWFGGVAAVILALLAGLSISAAMGVAAAVLTIAVLAFLEFVVEPRIFKRERLSSLLVVILVLLMVKEYGVFGFLVAPPLAAAVQIAANQLYKPTMIALNEVEAPPTIQIDLLKDRLHAVQAMAAQQSEPPPQEIVNLIDRLNELIDRAKQEEQFID